MIIYIYQMYLDCYEIFLSENSFSGSHLISPRFGGADWTTGCSGTAGRTWRVQNYWKR